MFPSNKRREGDSRRTKTNILMTINVLFLEGENEAHHVQTGM